MVWYVCCRVTMFTGKQQTPVGAVCVFLVEVSIVHNVICFRNRVFIVVMVRLNRPRSGFERSR